MIVIHDPSPELAAQLEAGLGRPDDVVVESDLAEARRMVSEGSADVLLCGAGCDVQDVLVASADLQIAAPGSGVILVTERPTTKLLRAALRAGVRDVLPSTAARKDLRAAVRRAETLARQLHGSSESKAAPASGKVITIFSSKGGCGKSFLASNLAVLLAQQTGDHVALVDLDLESGDQAIMLQLLASRTIWDAVQNLDTLDAEALRGYLTAHRSHVMLLAAPLEAGVGEKVSGEDVRRIIDMLRATFRYVVIDGPATFTEQLLSALDESDECVLVASMDVPNIRNLKSSLHTLETLGFKRDRLRIVLNRADSRVGLQPQEVEKAIGQKIEVRVPSSREVPLSVNRGVPLVLDAPESKVAAPLSALARAVGRTTAPAADKRDRFRLLRRFG